MPAGQVPDPRERTTRDSAGLYEHVNRVHGLGDYSLLYYEWR